MVKIHNVFGDKWYGKQDHMVYQRKGDYVVRRLDPPKNDLRSPTQLSQRQRFKIATNSWKQLTDNDKAGLENYFKNVLTQYDRYKFLHLYNMFKAYRMQKLNFTYKVVGNIVTFTFDHPFLKKVEIYAPNNTLLYSYTVPNSFQQYYPSPKLVVNLSRQPFSHAIITYLDNTYESISLPSFPSLYPQWTYLKTITHPHLTQTSFYEIVFAHDTPHNKYFIVAEDADYPGDFHVFNVETGNLVANLPTTSGRGRGADFSPDFQYAIVGGGGFSSTPRLYYTSNWSLKCTCYINTWNEYDTFLSFRKGTNHIMNYIEYHGKLRVYDSNCSTVANLPNIRSTGNAPLINFSEDGKLLSIYTRTSVQQPGSYVYLYNTSSDNPNNWSQIGSPVTVSTQYNPPKEPVITQDKAYVLGSHEQSSTINYYSTSNLSLVNQVTLSSGLITAFARNSRMHPFQVVLTRSPNRVYVVKDMQVVYTLDISQGSGNVHTVDVSADGKYLIVGRGNQVLVYYDPSYTP